MAVIDPRSGALVIRVVYDGAPGAGKTTSLRILAERLGTHFETPQEVNGRTVFFDWVDYTGGLFEGRRIRCQIITVPGQASLAPRRATLLRSADAVIFVGDTSPEGYSSLDRYLHGLLVLLRSVAGPAIGVVLQANKRDHAGAVPLEALRNFRHGEARLAVFESVATDGAGIREAFVFAVRLALDRVREQMASGELPHGPPDIDTADELLRHLKLIEGDRLQTAVDDGLVHTRLAGLRPDTIDAPKEGFHSIPPVSRAPTMASQGPTAASQMPTAQLPTPTARPPEPASAPGSPIAAPQLPELPTSMIPSGLVWPPIEGRIMLHHATSEPVLRLQTADAQYAYAGAAGWTFHSAPQAVFRDLNAARGELVAWARVHVAHASILSEQRCVVVSQDGERFRLWQAVRTCRNLSDDVREAACAGRVQFIAAVAEAAAKYVHAVSVFGNPACLRPARLEWVTHSATGPRYAGPMPYPPNDEPGGEPQRDVLAEFGHQLRALLPAAVAGNGELIDVIKALEASEFDTAQALVSTPEHRGACA